MDGFDLCGFAIGDFLCADGDVEFLEGFTHFAEDADGVHSGTCTEAAEHDQEWAHCAVGSTDFRTCIHVVSVSFFVAYFQEVAFLLGDLDLDIGVGHGSGIFLRFGMIFAWVFWGKVVHKRELKMGKVRFPEVFYDWGLWGWSREERCLSGYFVCRGMNNLF